MLRGQNNFAGAEKLCSCVKKNVSPASEDVSVVVKLPAKGLSRRYVCFDAGSVPENTHDLLSFVHSSSSATLANHLAAMTVLSACTRSIIFTSK